LVFWFFGFFGFFYNNFLASSTLCCLCLSFSDISRQITRLANLNARTCRHAKFAESLSWNSSGTKVALIFADMLGAQVTIVNTSKLPKAKFRFLSPKPHSMPLTAVRFASGSAQDCLLTGSQDHKIFHWNIGASAAANFVHQCHTSSILSLEVSNNNGYLCSGGADRKFICFSLDKSLVLIERVFVGKVNSVSSSPTREDTILISHTSKTEQLHVLDYRCKSSVMKFSWCSKSTSVLSRYIFPSWSPCGNFIACGSVDPQIHIWDIRFSRQYGLPTQSISCHRKRVLYASFHPVAINRLVSISSDRTMGLHRFSLV